MTVIADNERRVALPSVKPGDRLTVHIAGAGKFLLTLIDNSAEQRANVHLEKRDGFSVGTLDHAIDEEAMTDALRELP